MQNIYPQLVQCLPALVEQFSHAKTAAMVVCVFKTAPGGSVAKKLLISLSRVPSPLVQVFSNILTFILRLRCPFAVNHNLHYAMKDTLLAPDSRRTDSLDRRIANAPK